MDSARLDSTGFLVGDGGYLACNERGRFSEKVEFELGSNEGVSHVSYQERALQPKDQLVQRP